MYDAISKPLLEGGFQPANDNVQCFQWGMTHQWAPTRISRRSKSDQLYYIISTRVLVSWSRVCFWVDYVRIPHRQLFAFHSVASPSHPTAKNNSKIIVYKKNQRLFIFERHQPTFVWAASSSSSRCVRFMQTKRSSSSCVITACWSSNAALFYEGKRLKYKLVVSPNVIWCRLVLGSGNAGGSHWIQLRKRYRNCYKVRKGQSNRI